ncbi:hypothetical protein D3C71_734550 [compost metagenome]
MITAIEIENFKCFQNLRLELGKLTLLTGFNSGGKSSAIQPLLLLSQATKTRLFTTSLPLNGPTIKLGTVGDILPINASVSSLVFKLEDEFLKTTWSATARAADRQLELQESTWPIKANTDEDKPEEKTEETAAIEPQRYEYNITQLLMSLSYLSATRTGPDDAYPSPDLVEDGAVDVGADGRYASYWYSNYADNEVPEARRYPGESSSSFRKQFDCWFSSLFPDAQANVQYHPQLALHSLQFRISEFGPWRKPTNVGYGFSYVFPILVALLAASDQQVVAIDSPEAHLHPYAQSQMGKIIAHFAAAGVQLIVETHSDHLLNGLRLAIKDSTLPPDDLRIHFFTGAKESSHGIQTLHIDKEGRVNNWPDGFFDQAEKDMGRLSGWD